MLIVKIQEEESIEKALKQFKRKFNMSGIMRELKSREQFTKPSTIKRDIKKKAIYVQKLRTAEEKTQ